VEGRWVRRRGTIGIVPNSVAIGSLTLGAHAPLLLIAGPCVIESRAHAVTMARAIAKAAARLGLPYVYKASFDKANRTSRTSYRGPGLEAGLEVLRAVKEETGAPVLTDIHEPSQAEAAARCCDALQIPAFLCRQTDLLEAAARAGVAVNVKKGQFLSPWDMKHAVEKIRGAGNDRVFLTERGSTFGYNNLVVDMRSLQVMRQFAPVVFDLTHSMQLPGGQGETTGGMREFGETLARAATAAGIDGLFLEVHDNPAAALSDSTTQWPLDRLEPLLEQVLAIHATVRRSWLS
jgi:2-dehydro-3-deoxyphosphooctonate aldolase (KDO 8-P synthase)